MRSMTLLEIWLLVILLCATSSIYCQTVAEPPANFTETDAGTADNPYQIATLANLRWLSETVDVWGGFSLTYNSGDFYVVSGDPKHFIQTADIDASETIDWNGGLGFSPIGLQYRLSGETILKMYPFQGVYNGNNHTISNLYSNYRNYEPQDSWILLMGSFLGLVWHSTISNIHMVNANISNRQGMLVNSANHSSILNCSATGSLDNSSGLIREINYNSLVEYCSSVTYSNIYTGLLVGTIKNSIVRNSYARGCTQYVANNFIGLISIAEYSEINKVYIASIEDTTNVNRLIGGPHIYRISDSRWDIDTSNAPNPNEGFFPLHPSCIVENCMGLSTGRMKNPVFYYGWDFENIWAIDPDINDGYPYLRHDTIAQYLDDKDITIAPVTSQLLGNYPNPFNPVTTIRFAIAKDCNVTLDIYNIKGQLVRSLVNGFYKEGTHNVIWNGTDNKGEAVSSGVYFYRLNVGEFSAVKKMLLMK